MAKTKQQQERVNKLAQALKLTDKIHLKDAAVMLNVSEMTIRRDLNDGAESIVLLGGYVVNEPRSNDIVSRYLVSDQEDKQVEEKHHLGQVAAQLVKENDTIFFDCGTTIPFVISEIDDDIFFTAICYSLNTFLALQSKPNCKAILCGGIYNANNAIFTSLTRSNELDYLCPNKAFISAAGIHLQKGATCFNLDELPMKHQAIEMPNQKFLLVDQTKFDKIRPAFIGSLTLFDKIITNKKPNLDFMSYFEKHKIKILY